MAFEDGGDGAGRGEAGESEGEQACAEFARPPGGMLIAQEEERLFDGDGSFVGRMKRFTRAIA